MYNTYYLHTRFSKYLLNIVFNFFSYQNNIFPFIIWILIESNYSQTTRRKLMFPSCFCALSLETPATVTQCCRLCTSVDPSEKRSWPIRWVGAIFSLQSGSEEQQLPCLCELKSLISSVKTAVQRTHTLNLLLLLQVQPRRKESLLTCLADLFNSIATQKKKVGVIPPKKFISRLRKENGKDTKS